VVRVSGLVEGVTHTPGGNEISGYVMFGSNIPGNDAIVSEGGADVMATEEDSSRAPCLRRSCSSAYSQPGTRLRRPAMVRSNVPPFTPLGALAEAYTYSKPEPVPRVDRGSSEPRNACRRLEV
jgi:hypothetical protein